MPLPYKVGDNNFDVQTIRAALKGHGFQPGYSVLDPNLYDAWVQLAVGNFQKKVGLQVDGIVGPKTWAALTGTGTQPSTSPQGRAASASPNTDTSDLTVGLASGKLNQGTELAPLLLGPTGSSPGMSKMKLFLMLGLGGVALWYAKSRGWLRQGQV